MCDALLGPRCKPSFYQPKEQKGHNKTATGGKEYSRVCCSPGRRYATGRKREVTAVSTLPIYQSLSRTSSLRFLIKAQLNDENSEPEYYFCFLGLNVCLLGSY
ncbi:hypothetical protein ILYODFUR_007734 [Ilyodon furcidens]|uniref:Uncharacterized protein n=1 Tax=Ilyodon furcidens TaxID=33524 RepID=A0ABV0UPX9_9TELE